MVPGTFIFVVVIGLVFALPPGPLCDEGMVLFMEGGCDMGESNIVFFSKLGILMVLTFAYVLAWRRRVGGFAPFLSHFVVAAALAWIGRSGGACDTYYSHPNGSLGQMVVEVSAFGAVGIMLLNRWAGGSSRTLVATLVGWHALYVASFYVWLAVVPHWTWRHTWGVVLTMLLVGVAVSSNKGLKLTSAACQDGPALAA
jgi:hypothetical protein